MGPKKLQLRNFAWYKINSIFVFGSITGNFVRKLDDLYKEILFYTSERLKNMNCLSDSFKKGNILKFNFHGSMASMDIKMTYIMVIMAIIVIACHGLRGIFRPIPFHISWLTGFEQQIGTLLNHKLLPNLIKPSKKRQQKGKPTSTSNLQCPMMKRHHPIIPSSHPSTPAVLSRPPCKGKECTPPMLWPELAMAVVAAVQRTLSCPNKNMG